jgi:hemoglobin-like flavoprotein
MVGVAIYERLFALDPSLRALFGSDMRVHARNLMGAVGTVVRALDDLTPVLVYVRALGRRHASYGVQPRHIALGGAAVLAALETVLDDAFTPEARAAWTRAYETLAGAMIAAMGEAMPRAA